MASAFQHFHYAALHQSGESAVLRNLALPGTIVVCLLVGIVIKPGFFDLFSFSFTLGGALTVTCFSYSKTQLKGLLAAVRALFAAAPRDNLDDHIAELRRLTGLFRLQGLKGLENQERHLNDPYLRQGVELLVDLHNEETIRARMDHHLARLAGEHEINRQILMTLGKLLPSFGLIGTLIGMVMLLGNLSNQDHGSLPAALGLAVLTTLYGAVAANVVVAPLLARLQSAAVDREVRMQLTKEWVLLMLRGDAISIADHRKGSWPPHDSMRQRPETSAPLRLIASR
jgi:chemotaxis protein MotA